MRQHTRVRQDLAAARGATSRLLAHLDGLTEEVLRGPSLLPGWTRAHVVAHLTGNALSHVHLLEGCLDGEVRTQYDGSAVSREHDIEVLAAEPAAVVGAHRTACVRLERCWRAMTEEHWTRDVRWLDAQEPSPASDEPASRRREVEVHGVDLATGYGPWPEEFTTCLLDQLAARPDLPPLVLEDDEGRVRGARGTRVRGTAYALALWLAGRSDGAGLATDGRALPHLPPWR